MREPPEPGPRVGRSRAGPRGGERRRGLSPASPPGARGPPPASPRGPRAWRLPEPPRSPEAGAERRGDRLETPPRPLRLPVPARWARAPPPPPPWSPPVPTWVFLAKTPRLWARCPGLTPRPGAQLACLLYLQPGPGRRPPASSPRSHCSRSPSLRKIPQRLPALSPWQYLWTLWGPSKDWPLSLGPHDAHPPQAHDQSKELF